MSKPLKKGEQMFSYDELMSISEAVIASTASLRIVCSDIVQYRISDESIQEKIKELLAINEKVCQYAEDLEEHP